MGRRESGDEEKEEKNQQLDKKKVSFKLNKSVSKARSFAEAERENKIFWKDKTPRERLKASWYLTCQAWGLPYTTDIKLDKKIFSCRKQVE